MPVRFSVGFIPEKPISSDSITPDQVHGLFFSLLDKSVAEQLHKPTRFKPFCVGVPVIFREDKNMERIFLRISLLDEDLFPKILSSLILNKEDAVLSNIRLKKIIRPFIEERWIKSYKNIFDETEPSNILIFDFKTPTTFKKGEMDYPLPDPRLIFKGLIRKWVTFSDVRINIDLRNVIDEKIEIMGVWIRTKKVTFSKLGKLTGFTGRVVFYVNSENETILKWLNVLGKFSEFAGVGRKTTMGFGMVRFTNAISESNI